MEGFRFLPWPSHYATIIHHRNIHLFVAVRLWTINALILNYPDALPTNCFLQGLTEEKFFVWLFVVMEMEHMWLMSRICRLCISVVIIHRVYTEFNIPCIVTLSKLDSMYDMWKHPKWICALFRLVFQTYIGPVLISVNPYKTVNIYNDKVIETYRNVNFYELPPHMSV